MDETQSTGAWHRNVMTPDNEATAWADLLGARLQHEGEAERIVIRAKVYMDAGLPLERVLDALSLSRSGWYKRLATVEAARAARVVEYDRTHGGGAS